MKVLSNDELYNLLRTGYQLATVDKCTKFTPAILRTLNIYNIDNKYRIAAFLAQIGHESGQLRFVEENLNYSESALNTTFGKYFPNGLAREYAKRPVDIANIVYADRLGNGDTDSGDGWKYRGRGLIQVTGRNNYRSATNGMYGLPIGLDFENEPDQLLNEQYAAESAGWFWESNGLNSLADKLSNPSDTTDVFKLITRRINGGYNGLEDRFKLYNRLISNINE